MMNIQKEEHIKKSEFSKFFRRKNTLGFKEWVFLPGMLFEETDKWWGNKGKRDKPHEGIDLCSYKNGQNKILYLNEKTSIPVMYDGIIAKIMDDFLGETVIVEHTFKNDKLCSFYGHIQPDKSLDIGKFVKEGDIIGSLTVGKKVKDIFPHLHISMGRVLRSISYEQLNWETMNVLENLMLLDPLDHI